MTADMVIRFFENYGWIMTVLATSGIVFVGGLKSLGVFVKLNGKGNKYIYFACSCMSSIIACTIYLCATNAFDWADWGMTILCIVGYTVAIYGLYENTGLRALCKKIIYTPINNVLNKLVSLIVTKSISKDKVLSLDKGLGSEILLGLIDEVRINEETILNETNIADAEKFVFEAVEISEETVPSQTAMMDEVENTFNERQYPNNIQIISDEGVNASSKVSDIFLNRAINMTNK